MEQDVFADLLFLINFSMDYLCLYICARILHKKMRLWRMVASSAIGGIYSVLSLFIHPPAPFSVILDCAVCLIMCAVAFFERKRISSLFLTSFLYIGISMMTGGCMTAIFNILNKLDLPLDKISDDGISTYLFAILAVMAGIISLKSGQIISKRSGASECELKIKFCGCDFEFHALVDSGNLVKDPISGRPVIFLDRAVLEKKLDLSFLDSYKRGIYENDSPCRDLRLFSLNTANGSTLAVAAAPDKIEIEYKEKGRKNSSVEIDALISPIEISGHAAGCNAIIPAEIIK